MNVIAWVGLEFANYDSTIHHFNHYAAGSKLSCTFFSNYYIINAIVYVCGVLVRFEYLSKLITK